MANGNFLIEVDLVQFSYYYKMFPKIQIKAFANVISLNYHACSFS